MDVSFDLSSMDVGLDLDLGAMSVDSELSTGLWVWLAK